MTSGVCTVDKEVPNDDNVVVVIDVVVDDDVVVVVDVDTFRTGD